jgi:hypothetical protein
MFLKGARTNSTYLSKVLNSRAFSASALKAFGQAELQTAESKAKLVTAAKVPVY